MTTRLSMMSFAGMVRTEVAVGTSRLASMFSTTRAAGPRSRATPCFTSVAFSVSKSSFCRYDAVGAWAVAMGWVAEWSMPADAGVGSGAEGAAGAAGACTAATSTTGDATTGVSRVGATRAGDCSATTGSGAVATAGAAASGGEA